MNYLDKLTHIVENKISEVLPDRFEIVFDRWKSNKMNSVFIFSTFPSDKNMRYTSVILAIAPFEDEISQRTQEQ